jgi:hypothetical protein
MWLVSIGLSGGAKSTPLEEVIGLLAGLQQLLLFSRQFRVQP